MLSASLVKITILYVAIIAQVSGKYCESIESLCDCTYTHHDLVWNTHNIHCPKQVNGSLYDYTVRLIDTLSVEVECHNYSALVNLPMLNLNTHLYKVEFKNCFKNYTNSTNYRFELNKYLVQQLNVKVYKTINIVFNEAGQVNEKIFFNNLQLATIWNLKVENVQFETCEVLQDCKYLRVINFTNTNLVDFGQLNASGCENMRMFIVRNTNSVINLSRTNLNKVSKIQEFKIYNSDIVDYYDGMYKNGAIFYGIPLKYLVFETTFNRIDEKILLNETLLNGIDLYSLSLVGLKLEDLPIKLLMEQRSLRTLNLNKNKLATLHADLLVNCVSLRVVDLSNNNFVQFQDTSIFTNILSLTDLRLSYNQLESFKFDVPLKSNFSKIYLDHNYIKTKENLCPITGIRSLDGIIDLSFNGIIKSRSIIECLNSNRELKSLDVSNNQMIDLNFEDALPYGRPAIFNTRINLSNNKITYLDFLNYHPLPIVHIATNEVNVYLDSNPLFCHNCVHGNKMFGKKLLYYAINQTKFKIHHPTECQSSTSCLMSDIDETFKCPKPCDCLYNEYTKILTVDCQNNHLTSIPYLNATDLFKINFNKLILNLPFNRLTRISFANVSPALIQKLDTLNLANNLIEVVKIHPLEFPANLSVLQMSSNRITEFDETTMDLLNSRKYFLSVTLANNPIANNRKVFEKIKKSRKFKILDLEDIEEYIKMEESQSNMDTLISSSSKSNSTGLLFGVVVTLFLVVVAGLAMMYSYRRYAGAAIFQRLRDQRGTTSEIMLGGFQDD